MKLKKIDEVCAKCAKLKSKHYGKDLHCSLRYGNGTFEYKKDFTTHDMLHAFNFWNTNEVDTGSMSHHEYAHDGEANWEDDSFDHAFGTEHCGHVQAEVTEVYMILRNGNKIVNYRRIEDSGDGSKVFREIEDMLVNDWAPDEPDYDEDEAFERRRR
jgi:hypothetical protein